MCALEGRSSKGPEEGDQGPDGYHQNPAAYLHAFDHAFIESTRGRALDPLGRLTFTSSSQLHIFVPSMKRRCLVLRRCATTNCTAEAMRADDLNRIWSNHRRPEGEENEATVSFHNRRSLTHYRNAGDIFEEA